MSAEEIRSLLSLYRAGDEPLAEERFEEAKRAAEDDPALALWWAEERELDRAIAAKLAAVPVPAGIAARLLSPPAPVAWMRSTWRRSLLLAAAAIVALAIIFGSWRGPFQPANSLADYRDEMVGFIKVPPSLEMKSDDLGHVNNFLAHAGAPSRLALPAGLRSLEPVGCRTLRFHGHDVALVCFKRANGKLAHLFVLSDSSLGDPPARDGKPAYTQEGEWMTAAWSESGHAYLLAVQGDRAEAEEFFGNS